MFVKPANSIFLDFGKKRQNDLSNYVLRTFKENKANQVNSLNFRTADPVEIITNIDELTFKKIFKYLHGKLKVFHFKNDPFELDKSSVRLYKKLNNDDYRTMNLIFDKEGRAIRIDTQNRYKDVSFLKDTKIVDRHRTHLIDYEIQDVGAPLQKAKTPILDVSEKDVIKDGKSIYNHSYVSSYIKGKFNIYERIGRKKFLTGLAEMNASRDTIIEKTLTAPSGVKTDYFYFEKPNGMRLIYNKITDESGKTLLEGTKKMKIIDENHRIFYENGFKYDVKYLQDKVFIQKNKIGTQIIENAEFFRSIFDKDMAPMMQKLSGSELYAIAKWKIAGIRINPNIKMQAYYNKFSNEIFVSPNLKNDLFALSHELGHFKDQFINISKDKKLVKLYIKEQEKFLQCASPSELFLTRQFMHVFEKKNSIQELIAETNALLNSSSSSSLLSIRGEFLQRYFPETIAYIGNKL